MAIYYVTQAGAGAHDGSSLAAAESIAHFNSNNLGDLTDDTVYFDGTFTTTLNTPAGCLGTSASHLATLDLTTATWDVNGTDQLWITRAYVRVQNALLINVHDTGAVCTGIWVDGANCQIHNNTIVGTGPGSTFKGHTGIHMTAGGSDMRITDNNISHVMLGIRLAGLGFAGLVDGNIINDMDQDDPDDADGIAVSGSALTVRDYTGLTISHNTISNWGDDGIDLYYGMNVIVEYNDIGPFTSAAVAIDGNGIKCGNDANTVGNIIRNNYVHDLTSVNGANFGITNNGTDHVIIYNNYVTRCVYGLSLTPTTHGHRVYNNTFSACTTRGITVSDDVIDTIIQNNICDGGTWDMITNAGDSIVGGGNCLKNNRHSFAANTYTESSAPDIHSDPHLANGYCLLPCSPCIRAGLTLDEVTNDIDGYKRPGRPGNKYSIGCCEYLGTNDPDHDENCRLPYR